MLRKKTSYILCLFFFPIFTLFSLDGIHYSHLEIPNTSYFGWLFGPQSIHTIEVDPSFFTIKPVKALDDGIGRESVLSIAQRHQAIASVNGGFFSIGGTFDGRACGTLKIKDWYALPFKPRGCIGWSEDNQRPLMDRLLVTIACRYNMESFLIDGLNRARKDGDGILYTFAFHRTTLTLPDGEEVLIRNGMIEKVIPENGSAKIPENGYVLSLQKNHPFYGHLKERSPISFQIDIQPQSDLTTSQQWDSLDYIVGGTPLLLHHSAKIIGFEAEQTIETFLSNKHARTAVGILPNGNWLFVVVDKTNLFDGMTMYELVNLMSELGCIDALNLDGGGSSTMVYENEIKNSPRGDEDEGLGKKVVRRVSDAIVIISKNS